MDNFRPFKIVLDCLKHFMSMLDQFWTIFEPVWDHLWTILGRIMNLYSTIFRIFLTIFYHLRINWYHFMNILNYFRTFNLVLFMAFQNHYPELIGHSVEVLLPPTKEYKKTGCNWVPLDNSSRAEIVKWNEAKNQTEKSANSSLFDFFTLW